MIVDANVVIALLDPDDVLHADAARLVMDAAAEPLVVPALTLAEALVAPYAAGVERLALAALRDLSITVDPGVFDPVSLARIRADAPVKMPDCVVIETAERLRQPLATFDHRLAGAARVRGIQVRPGVE